MTIEEQIKQKRQEIQKAVSYNILSGFESDIEKARHGVYADTAENRKLGRVGQEYGKSSNMFRSGNLVRVTLPTGRVIEATYVEPYSKGHTVKDKDGKLYGITADKIEKIKVLSKKNFSNLGDKISDLERERKRLELEMEDVLSQLSEEERNDGNNKLVKYYGRELDKIDKQIINLKNNK